MSDPNTLGRLVRRRRLESGYSLGQLASKVGKTAAEVRAWERDSDLPEHGILERLASTLELDLDDLKARLEAAQQEAEREEAEEAADTAEEAPETAEEAPETADEQPDTAANVVEEVGDGDTAGDVDAAEPEAEAEPDVEGDAETDAEPQAETEAESDAAATDQPDPGGDAGQDRELIDAPTEPVPVPVITPTATAARAQRAVAVIEEPPQLAIAESTPDSDPGLLRYLEPLRILFDPNNRYLYWIRAGLTVVVMMLFAVILLDQVGKLLDAIGELLDTIEPSATTPDDLDAMGRLGLS